MRLRLPVLTSPPGCTPSRPARRRFWGEKYLRFRCTLCGNCCTDTIVPITGEDLARLATGTGLPVDEIATFYAADDFADGGTGLAYAELDIGPRTLGLVKRPGDGGAPDACRFFDGVCTVYEHRPVTCRVWPFSLGFDDRGRVNRLAVNRTVTCPHELDGEVDVAEVARDWRSDDRQDGLWQRTVDRWNRRHRGGSAEAFLDWLGFPARPPLPRP